MYHRIYWTTISLLLWHVSIQLNPVRGISSVAPKDPDTDPNAGTNGVPEVVAVNDPLKQKLITESQTKNQRAVTSAHMYPHSDACLPFSNVDSQHPNMVFSPGYPNNYPNNTDCVRVLKAENNEVLRLDFRDSFTIEPSEDCKFDFLEIRDGAHGFSKLLGQFCGTDFPPIITSTDRFLWLHFHSDDNIEYSGFSAIWESIDKPHSSQTQKTECKKEFHDNQGWINETQVEKVRNDTHDQGIPLDCMWEVKVSKGWRIQLEFLSFSLAKPNDCDSNFIDIFDGKTDIPSRKRNFCGSIADGVNSNTNEVYIRFFIEPHAANSKFSIFYTAYHEKSGQACEDNEFDCQDTKCISEDLMCNGVVNCQYKHDEAPENCPTEQTAGPSEHIVIIIVVFGLILGGMMVTFLINCLRKLARDQKIIREHIRQSRESQIDALGRREMKKSMESINRIKDRSVKTVDLHEAHMYQRQESGKSRGDGGDNGGRSPDEDDFLQRELNERDLYGSGSGSGNGGGTGQQEHDIELVTRSRQVYPIEKESRMCETAVQTRESLFQNVHIMKPSSEIHTPEARLSSFGKPQPQHHLPPLTLKPMTSITSGDGLLQRQQQHQQHAHHYDTRPPHADRYASTYSQQESERKSAPDVIIMTSVQR